jgi:hypothetical protein
MRIENERFGRAPLPTGKDCAEHVERDNCYRHDPNVPEEFWIPHERIAEPGRKTLIPDNLAVPRGQDGLRGGELPAGAVDRC